MIVEWMFFELDGTSQMSLDNTLIVDLVDIYARSILIELTNLI